MAYTPCRTDCYHVGKSQGRCQSQSLEEICPAAMLPVFMGEGKKECPNGLGEIEKEEEGDIDVLYPCVAGGVSLKDCQENGSQQHCGMGCIIGDAEAEGLVAQQEAVNPYWRDDNAKEQEREDTG